MSTCICGHRATTACAITRHRKTCENYQASVQTDLQCYKETVQGTDKDLRGYKRRRTEVLPACEGPSTTVMDPDNILDVNEHSEMSPVLEPLTNEVVEPLVRQQRNRGLPLQYRDELPLPEAPPVIQEQPLLRVTLHVSQPFETMPNKFGLFRRYIHAPSFVPDDGVNLEEQLPEAVEPELANYYPFPNFSQYQLAHWFTMAASGTVSGPLFNQLLDHIRDPRFKIEDCEGFTHRRALDLLGSIENDSKHIPWLSTKDRWQTNKLITISIPEGKQAWTSQNGRTVDIQGLHIRSIVEIIRTVYSTATNIHYTPYELFHKNGENFSRVYGEIFGSAKCISEYRKLPRIPNCNLEQTIAPLMFWSDATHLTSFGTAKLWPIYMCFGSQSKYTRIQPKSRQCHHVAYIPSLPDNIQDIIQDFTGGNAARLPILTHCQRELMQGVWNILLDEAFITSYKEGIVILCPDGKERRVFPRIFTYSADYPEKFDCSSLLTYIITNLNICRVLLATIRDKGLCPCPRCLVAKTDICQMGSFRDMRARVSKAREDTPIRQNRIHTAREMIYGTGVPLQSVLVERLLKEHSYIPTTVCIHLLYQCLTNDSPPGQNTFSQKLFNFNFDFHQIFVVDFLHEIELGVWKALFTHLIRVLYADHEAKVQELNRRYRLIPTFGRDTIRRFANNVAKMKKLAARDFEDILQCAITAFEGLFPDKLDNLIQDILFVFSSWHGICKLRLHTDNTLHYLESLTKELGKLLRQFQSVTHDMAVVELPREVSARQRRQTENFQETSRNTMGGSSQVKHKTLNLSTYKFHSMGDYAATIRHIGTIESYSTQSGELQHRTVKRCYLRSARAHTAASLTTIESQERRIGSISARLTSQKATEPAEHFSYVPPREHYHISSGRKNPINIIKFLKENEGDAAVKNFYPLLKDHILARLMGLDYNGDESCFTGEDRNQVFIKNEIMYQNRSCRLNFTTYDIHRSQDVINPGYGHSDIMVLAREDASQKNSHCYWYARVIGIFHLKASRRLPNGELTPDELLCFLWVRWFGKDFTFKAGTRARRLDRIAFINEDNDTEPFGFLDPALVLRTAHIIPAFAHGIADTSALTSSKLAHPSSESPMDWNYYYANRFVDRDMLMQYLGQGIGHSFIGTNSASSTEPLTGPSEAGEDLEIETEPVIDVDRVGSDLGEELSDSEDSESEGLELDISDCDDNVSEPLDFDEGYGSA